LFIGWSFSNPLRRNRRQGYNGGGFFQGSRIPKFNFMQGVYTAAGSMKAMHWMVPAVNPPRSGCRTGVGLTASAQTPAQLRMSGALGMSSARSSGQEKNMKSVGATLAGAAMLTLAPAALTPSADNMVGARHVRTATGRCRRAFPQVKTARNRP
jgi:hypothetical protein